MLTNIAWFISLSNSTIELCKKIKSSLRRLIGTTAKKPKIGNLWRKYTSSPQQTAIKDKECAWLLQWNGLPVQSIELVYDQNKRYDRTMPRIARHLLKRWCKDCKSKKVKRLKDLENEDLGMQVRLEEVELLHGSRYNYRIHLSPTKYLFYEAIHVQLEKSENKVFKKRFFWNAMQGLLEKETLKLPSTFAIHMGVISSDNNVILRRRKRDIELYPWAWEAGIGEFMHGPRYKWKYPHFNEDGEPDLALYLKNAIFEELNYLDAKLEHFRIFGFAVERKTLAPKLLVVYKSDASANDLISCAKEAEDKSDFDLKAVKLTPHEIAKAITDPNFSSWGPTSKLTLMLALTCNASSYEKKDICDEVAVQIIKLKRDRHL